MKRIVFLLHLSLFCCQPKESDPSSTRSTSENHAPVETQEATTPVQEPDNPLFAKGEKLFTENCKACHNKTSQRMIGPGLEGITKRQSREQIKAWITNSQELIASGDPYAIKVYEDHNKIPMPSFVFTDEEIDALIYYIDGK